MIFEKFKTDIHDTQDTIFYGNGKTKVFWNPNSQSYRIGTGKLSLLFNNIDYYALMDNKFVDIGKLVVLLTHANTKNYFNGISTNAQLAELLGSTIDNGTTKKFIRSLYKKQILRKDNITKRIYINPLVSLKTDWLDIDCYRVFRDELLPTLTLRQQTNLDKHMRECCICG